MEEIITLQLKIFIMQNKKTNNWIVFGLSNFSYDILDAIESIGGSIDCFVTNQKVDPEIIQRVPHDIKIIPLTSFKATSNHYFIGFMDYHKDELLEDLASYRITFDNIIHQRAYVSKYAKLGQGNFIGANATIAPKVTIGDFNFINRNSSIGHHSMLSNRNKTGPGVTISSLCSIGSNNAFGSNSALLPEINIKDNIVVGAGSVVTSSIEVAGTYVGSPARKL